MKKTRDWKRKRKKHLLPEGNLQDILGQDSIFTFVFPSPMCDIFLLDIQRTQSHDSYNYIETREA